MATLHKERHFTYASLIMAVPTHYAIITYMNRSLIVIILLAEISYLAYYVNEPPYVTETA